MNCQEAREILTRDFPSKMGEREREANEHVLSCSQCQSHFGEMKILREQLSQLKPEPASSEFKERLFTAISRARWEKSVRRWRTAGIWMLSTAASLILLVLGWLWLMPEPKANPEIVEYLVTDHQQILPGRFMVASSSPSEIESWFEGKLDFRVSVRELKNAQIQGARLCQVEDRRAALIFYRCDTHIVSWFIFPEKFGDEMGEEPRLYESRGFTVYLWNEKGLQHALISDLDIEELVSILPR